MNSYMNQTTANFHTSGYGQQYMSPQVCKISKSVLAKDKKGNLIEKDGYYYLSTNPEKYVKYKEENNNNKEFNWLWLGGGYSTNPDNDKSNGNSWKLDKYNNVMGDDLYVSYKILVHKRELELV